MMKGNSAVETVFVTVLSPVRNILDPNFVAKVVDELCARHGATLLGAVLEAVEHRLREERDTLGAGRAIPPHGLRHEAQHRQHGHS
jgi:hypothetical protein